MPFVKMVVSGGRARRGRGYGRMMRYAGLAARGASVVYRNRGVLSAGARRVRRGVKRLRDWSRSTTRQGSGSTGSRVSSRKRFKASPRSVKRRRFATSGVYGGRFGRSGRTVKDVYATRGAVFLSEFGGTRSGSEVVTIGHTTCALQNVMQVWMRAIIRRLQLRS